MRIVQSYWTKPFFNSGGWCDIVYHYISCTLSCLKLVEYYEDVELYTDEKGYDLLIKKLKLPYTRVYVCLNDIDKYNSVLWALGKIYTYSLQKTPFIHIDNDVFIWEKFPKRIEGAELIAQHFENKYYYNTKSYFDLLKAGVKYKEYMVINKSERINESNLGIVGGSNLLFFQNYTKEVFEFIEMNSSFIYKKGAENLSMINNIFEQYLFYLLAKKMSCNIEYLLSNISDSFKELVDFYTVPLRTKFIHMIGYHKKNSILCYLLGQRLYYEYPEYYKIITKYIN